MLRKEIKKRIFENKDILFIKTTNIDYYVLVNIYEYLTKVKNPIILLCSTGGDGESANGIVDLIDNCGKDVAIVGLGCVQSAATFIMAHGKPRLAFKRCRFFTHLAKSNEKWYQKIKSNSSQKMWYRYWCEEWGNLNLPFLGNTKYKYFWSDEAKKIGLIDEII